MVIGKCIIKREEDSEFIIIFLMMIESFISIIVYMAIMMEPLGLNILKMLVEENSFR